MGKSKLKILFLAPQLPYPPHQGTSLRNYNLIVDLARTHEIHLVCFVPAETTVPDLGPLDTICAHIYTLPKPTRTLEQRLWTTLTSPHPDMAHRLFSMAFGDQLAHILEQETFDVVQIEGIEMSPYLEIIQKATTHAQNRPFVVLDNHNAEYVLQRRVFESDIKRPQRWLGALYSFIQWHKLKKYEADICRQADAVVAVSKEDAKALEHLVPELEITVVPNGVDIADYSSFHLSAQLDPALELQSVVFTGTMDFRPNVDGVLWFAEKVLPLLQQQLPNIHFYVVGQRPHRRLDKLRENERITITGRVEDTRPYFAQALVYVIPLRSGGGTRLKVLEAMAMRKAIVSTSMGCDGYPVVSDTNVVLADDPKAFAEHVVQLLGDEQKRETLGSAALAFANEYDWRRIVPILEKVYPSGE